MLAINRLREFSRRSIQETTLRGHEFLPCHQTAQAASFFYFFFYLFFFFFFFFFYFRNAIYGRITISFGHPRDQRTLLASTLPLASSTPTISARSSHFFAVNNNGRKKSSLMDLSGAPTILLPDRPSILYLLTGTCWAWFIGHFLLGIFIEESCTFCDRI